MDLMTKCPQCGTVFPASLSELQLRKGYIRCIGCANIFDGYEAVVPNGQGAAAPAVSSPPPSSRQAPFAAPAEAAPSVVRQRGAGTPGSSAPASASPGIFAPARQRDDDGEASAFALRLDDGDLPASARRPEPGLYSGDGMGEGDAPEVRGIYAEPRGAMSSEPSRGALHDDDVLPDFLYARRQRRHGFARVFWSVLVLAGLVFLLAQLGYVYRTQIAASAPMLRPLLEQACLSLHCKVGYSRRIEHISIMDSSLQSAPRNDQLKPNENAMLLRVVLRNSYDKPQAWPTLTLDLVDFSGSVVVRRKLAPKDYLPPEALGQPFAANTERQITVPLIVAGVKINGYQLGKFYSPEG